MLGGRKPGVLQKENCDVPFFNSRVPKLCFLNLLKKFDEVKDTWFSAWLLFLSGGLLTMLRAVLMVINYKYIFGGKKRENAYLKEAGEEEKL